MSTMDFNGLLRQKTEFINHTLERLLAFSQIEGRLKEALSYTLTAPGKRLRSALLLWCCELTGGQVNHNAEIAAAAIEMVHTYSLIHDDLPAIDNDDIRRGLPTCHKAFDEATAILAGDALLTLAFEILAKEVDDPAVAVKLIAQLAQDSGPSGMIAGQMADLIAENGQGNKKLLEHIHTNKTAKMFRCATVMGAVCGGATNEQLNHLSEYGLKIGLGFQIADDILDISSTSEHLGKTAGKDAKAAKCTYPSIVGIEEARQLEQKLAEEAMTELVNFGRKADTLRQLAMALLKRTR